MWSSSVSRDTSGRHLQTQEILQKDLADESRLEHLATGEDCIESHRTRQGEGSGGKESQWAWTYPGRVGD